MLGSYLATSDASTLETVVAAIGHRPRGTELRVAINFNTYLELMDGKECDAAITAVIATEGLEDMTEHFLPKKLLLTRDGQTWSQEVRFQTDYIPGKDHRLFQNVAVWDPRHNTDH